MCYAKDYYTYANILLSHVIAYLQIEKMYNRKTQTENVLVFKHY